jgi:ankyrin repeat protein
MSTALHWAVQSGNIEVVSLLLERGANAEAKDKVLSNTRNRFGKMVIDTYPVPYLARIIAPHFTGLSNLAV